MTRTFVAIIIVIFLAGCASHIQDNPAKVAQWYASYEGRFLGAMYYRGSDDQFHYFTCRSMDTWVMIEIPLNELVIEDIRSLNSISAGGTFPGYYTVEPSNGFRKKHEADSAL